MIYQFKNFKPYIHPSSFVHPLAAVTGCVKIGANVYIGPFAAIRGDFGEIIIEDGCNIQEHVMIHMFPGITVRLDQNVHVGHGAIIHGAHIESDCLIGMNSVIMDDSKIGSESIIGALSFIKEGSIYDKRSLIVGNPAKVIKQVSDEMLDWKKKGTNLYQLLAAECLSDLQEVDPYTHLPENWETPTGEFLNWKKQKL
ncbi:MAG: transferase hexapeptide repeat family protein [Saprospiraceae bacterium]|nr:transferase hexapeptide repeat family protein [Saprospiraceae bacterium]MBK7812185.1 transferase hexapeptide repeat family protein [Saprospiraceae bacterium]MBK9632597.1 transferase hexapeptide repeat family protein [Saprospiraceae bacterium]